MYPRNAAFPERIAVGQVVLISDGTVQSIGVAVTVRGQGAAEAAGGGTIAYGADNTVYYTPTQAETNSTSFVVIASKASCFSASQTVITTASATAGKVVLSGETHTAAVIPTVTTLTGHTAQTGDAFARLGAPAGASVSADVAAVKSDTAATLLDTGTDGVVVAAASKTGYALSAAGVQAVWDSLSSALTTVGSIGKRLVDYLTGDSFARLGAPVGASISADVAAVQADTDNIQTRLPAALVGGRIDASVGAMAANTLTASALASDAVAEIQDGLAKAAALAAVDTVVNSILAESLTHPTLLEIEASTVLAKASATTDIKAVVDAVLVDTAELQVAHTNGNLGANVDKINGVTITGNGSTIPFNVV